MAFDPCYHKNCDDFANIHRLGIHEMGQNAGNALHFFSTLNNLRSFLLRPLNNEKIVITQNNEPEKSERYLKI